MNHFLTACIIISIKGMEKNMETFKMTQSQQAMILGRACTLSLADKYGADKINIESNDIYIKSSVLFSYLDDDSLYNFMEAGRYTVDNLAEIYPYLSESNLKMDVKIICSNNQYSVNTSEGNNSYNIYCQPKPNNSQSYSPIRASKEKDSYMVENFCNEWTGYNCSDEYVNEINLVAKMLAPKKDMSWDTAFGDDISEIYDTVLSAFAKEITRQCGLHEDFAGLMVKHFMRSTNVSSVEYNVKRRRVTFKNRSLVMPDEMYNNTIGRVILPCRLLSISKKPAVAAIALTFDNNWIIDMRIHKSTTKVYYGGLSFDIKVYENTENSILKQTVIK